MWDFLKAPTQLGSQNEVTLVWTPKRKEYKENEEPEKAQASMSFISPSPFCEITKSTIKTIIHKTINGTKIRPLMDNSLGKR